MIPLAKKATPAAIAVLRQATAHWPKRNKASDGLLPSAAHVHQNPNSDHNSGFAVDLTTDPGQGRKLCSDLPRIAERSTCEVPDIQGQDLV
jgi:hypothetical protein